MASGSLWTPQNESVPRSRSFIDSFCNFARKRTKKSLPARSSVTCDSKSVASVYGTRGLIDLNPFPRSTEPPRRYQNPLNSTSPLTDSQDRSGLNVFVTQSNELPPAYTVCPTTANSQAASSQPSGLAVPVSTGITGEDPYSFLGTFNTILLIDDSGSMFGRSWREVSQALATLAPVVTSYDSDGIDIYFLNHKSRDAGVPSEGIAATGFRCINRAAKVTQIFERVKPCGGTPTGTRIHSILKPYLAKLEKAKRKGKEVKPMNLIVLIDGIPSDDVESVLLSTAKKLDKLDAPPYQVGVQFF